MVNSKDLRHIFDEWRSEASKRAGEAMRDVDHIRRPSGPPSLLVLGIGLVLGAAIGMVAAILASPYDGKQVRMKLGERVEKMRRQHEAAETNGVTHDEPISSFERTVS
jgi:hypothetical protein